MARYSNIPTVKSSNGKTVYQTVRYPDIPRSDNDIYVFTTIGDRYDTLAQQYYGDSDLWWVIANANGNLDKSSLTPPLGSQIRVPNNPSLTLSEFGRLNVPTTFTNTPNVNSGGSSGY